MPITIAAIEVVPPPLPPSDETILHTLFPLGRAWRMVRSRLGSGLRTALACVIVGCVTVYGPDHITSLIPFPAFSYVTAVLVAGEATVGDSVRSAVSILYGSVLTMVPTGLSFVAFDHERFSAEATAVVVALASFAVTLPESTPLITKRVSLGQIVLVYVEAFKKGKRVGDGATVLWQLIFQAVASTAVRVVAAVLAVLLPYPRLACLEVRRKGDKYIEMAMKKLKLLVAGFCSDDKPSAVAYLSLANSFSGGAAKLLQSIKTRQGEMQWEKLGITFMETHFRSPSDRLEAIGNPLRGMEMALSAALSSSIKKLDEDFKDHLHDMEEDISLMLKDHKKEFSRKKVADEEERRVNIPFTNIPFGKESLSTIFFFFCLKLLHNQTFVAPMARRKKVGLITGQETIEEYRYRTKGKTPRSWSITISIEMIMVALKCSISMGIAVLLGLYFDRNNGHWSGLTVAMAITPWRESTFKLANLRAQGTALGSVYGVLCSFLSQNLMELRFLALLPWIVFTSFLRRSKMYGHAGAITAAVSAIIILGRRRYGSQTLLAIERLSETFIGLMCSILVEVLLQPKRASTLARERMCHSLQFLNQSVELLLLVLQGNGSIAELKEKVKKAMGQIHELRKFMVEAESEPNFWFLPFHVSCYSKLHGSLTKMVELVNLLGQSLQLLQHEFHGNGLDWADIEDAVRRSAEPLSLVRDSTKCFEDILRSKSLRNLDKELQRRTISVDGIESGEKQSADGVGIGSIDQEDCDRKLVSFLQQGRELADKTHGDDYENLDKNHIVLYLGTIGFCVEGVMEETMKLEKEIQELLQWENPSKHINMYDISRKLKNVPQF